jgi:hypothetical protein
VFPGPFEHFLSGNRFHGLLHNLPGGFRYERRNAQHQAGKTTLGLTLFEPFEFTQDGFDNFAAPKELFPLAVGERSDLLIS